MENASRMSLNVVCDAQYGACQICIKPMQNVLHAIWSIILKYWYMTIALATMPLDNSA